MQFAPLYPVLHRVLKPLFPQCLWAGDPQRRVVALTFDDGPHPRYTPALLEVLERQNVVASFFWLGACVERSPAVAQAVHRQGHWIGLHGYTHRAFPRLSPLNLKADLEKTQRAIAHACQWDFTAVQRQVRDVRPPLGLFTPATLRHLQQWHYRPVMWSVVPEDWVEPGVHHAVDRVLRQAQPGSLIVLHDGAFGGTDVAATAEQVIIRLKAEGYEWVTVDELWQSHCLGVQQCQEKPSKA